MHPIVPRGLAIAKGEQDYFTGIPCKRGHVALRTVSSGMCKTCASEANKAWMAENAEYRRDFDRKIKQKNRVKILAQKKAWRLRNLEKALKMEREIHARRLARDPIGHRIRASQWQKDNPDKVRARFHRRRARESAAEGKFTAEDIRSLFTTQNGQCAYCFVDLGKKYHVDHILPLVRGGSNWPDNLQLCCPTCNVSKGAKNHAEFMRYLGRSV